MLYSSVFCSPWDQELSGSLAEPLVESKMMMYCKTIFFVFSFLCLFRMLLKGMVESFLLSGDEPLTPNIDKAMGV